MIGLDHRQVFKAEEPLRHERFRQVFRQVRNRGKRLHRTVELLVEFFAGHHIDVPADQLGGETDILTHLANRQRQLVFANEDDHLAQHGAHDHVFDFGRLEGVRDQDGE